MKEFVFIFRSKKNVHANVSPEEMKERMNWITSLASQNKLVEGNRVSSDGAITVKPGDIITDGPYSDAGEFISGYIVVKTDGIEEAIALAKTNPMLKIGGSIEIRTVVR